MCLLGCPLLSCFEGLCVRYPCVMASAMCLLPRLPGGAMAERETVLGDGAARRDAAVQASLWIRSPKSPRPSARRDARGRVAWMLAAVRH